MENEPSNTSTHPDANMQAEQPQAADATPTDATPVVEAMQADEDVSDTAAVELQQIPQGDVANNGDRLPDVKLENANANVKEEDEAASPTAEKPIIEPIYYDMEPGPTAESVLKAKIDEERQKQQDRVRRFASDAKKISLSKVTETSVLGARRAAVRRGFATGFDLASPEEERKRQARLARFGPIESHPFCKDDDDPAARMARTRRFSAAMQDATALIAKDALESKRVVMVGETPRANVLHLHGVDQMSTKEVVKHFLQFGPSWCEWLNDSNCNIAFEDGFTMARALRRMSIASTPSGTPSQSMDAMQDASEALDGEAKVEPVAADSVMDDGVGSTDMSNDLLFRPLRPFSRKGHVIPLWGRMATEADVRPDRPNPQSKWSRTVKRTAQSKEEPVVGMSEQMGSSQSREAVIKKLFGVNKLRGNSISKSLKKKKSSKMDIDRALSSS